MKQALLIVVLLVLAITSRQSLSADKAELEAGEAAKAQAKEQKRCLTLSRIKSTRVEDDQSIIFLMRGGLDYRNTLPHRCPGLGFYKSFGYRTGTNAVCDLDIITVLESGRRGASCGLGVFVGYDSEQEAAEAGAQSEGESQQ